MHTRRLICFLLGLWLAGATLMTGVTRENRRSVERALAGLDASGAASAANLISEQNRRLDRVGQSPNAAGHRVVLCCCVREPGRQAQPAALVSLMLAIAAVQVFALTPEQVVNREAEALKISLGLALAIRLMIRRRDRSEDAGKDIDVIDKANYRHVNR